jgi:hypothetical protein
VCARSCHWGTRPCLQPNAGVRQVKEGRAKRLGKVIPYKRSELRSVEIIEGLCAKLSSYGTYKRIPRETQLRKLSEMADSDKADSEQRKRDQGAFERHCERLVEEQEQDIIRAVREELNTTQFQDALCFSEAGPCGPARLQCVPGAFSTAGGVAPCTLCARGFFQNMSNPSPPVLTGHVSSLPCTDWTCLVQLGRHRVYPVPGEHQHDRPRGRRGREVPSQVPPRVVLVDWPWELQQVRGRRLPAGRCCDRVQVVSDGAQHCERRLVRRGPLRPHLRRLAPRRG